MKLTDIAEINPSTEVHLGADELVSFIPMSDVTDDGRWVGNASGKFLVLRHSYTCFRNGDILLAKITPCMENGKGCIASGLINGVGCGSTEFHIIRPKLREDAEYIFQWTKSKRFRVEASKAMTGSAGQQRVPESFLLRYEIADHSRRERSAIGHVLKLVDLALENKQLLESKERRIMQGMIHDLLTVGVDCDGCLREIQTQSFKASELGLIPEEWTVVTVEALCSQIVDCPHSTPKYLSTGIPCIRTADMLPGELLLDQAFRVDEATYEKRVTRLIPKEGDIIYSREGERLGIASPVGAERVCLGQRVMLLRPGNDTDPDFLLWSLNNPTFYDRVIVGLGATTSPHINVDDVRQALLVKPRPEEQKKIGAILANHFETISATKSSFSKLMKIRNGLMQDLLTGHVSSDSIQTDLQEVTL